MEPLNWTRPSACADATNCPEVAVTDAAVYLRSSLRPAEVTQLTPTEWRDLLAGIRNGEFDI
ncbi:hypothetical protein ADK60_33400 [Streptomyces sp. XY431]|uniref:DUF397 domain-containing protein n=1 Tax=Streptomyces sp. XY431 TaxID=1415562 RepID=UPI0006AFF957|nr:DUF397 domain-containing protein [Streptomyces sp. XY431]KOV12104.1 hypothetical protein ADK60_33400 [Streptomyces sp. XY431]